jgi:Mg-chelatase subunit ChlD
MKINKIVSQLTGSFLVLNLCASASQAAPASMSVESAGKKRLSGQQKLIEVPRPQMDLAFCIDTTGSMQNEIDMVKTKTRDMVAKLSSGKPAPIIRIGLVAYRDLGDEYVTKVFPFTSDIDKVVKDISQLKADGGGDAPEAVDRGLHSALTELQWATNTKTAKLLFLIGDAGPHGSQTDLDWRKDCRDAIKRGIQINTMGCQGLNNQPLEVFKEIAKLTDGKFESLAYRQEVVDAGGKRSTLVYSGDAVYRMSPRASGDWKDAVSRGLMEKVSDRSVETSSSRGFAYAGSAMAAGAGGGGGLAATPMPAPSPRLYAKASGASAYATTSSSYGMSVERRDNNLDELMLDAARKRAESSLKVTY